MNNIYIASKTKHAETWQNLRAVGVQIISTWIDEAGPGETSDWADLWSRCIREASTASALVVFKEDGEILKGALVEVGAALAAGVPVFAVGCDGLNFTNHPGVTKCASMMDALGAIKVREVVLADKFPCNKPDGWPNG